jgi:hypothetical protein
VRPTTGGIRCPYAHRRGVNSDAGPVLGGANSRSAAQRGLPKASRFRAWRRPGLLEGTVLPVEVVVALVQLDHLVVLVDVRFGEVVAGFDNHHSREGQRVLASHT